MKINTTLPAILLLALIISCSPRVLVKEYNSDKINKIYSEGVGDAAKPQPWEISTELIPISKDNKDLVWKEIEGESYLLVSSWKEEVKYYKNDPNTGFYNTGKYPIWVTTAPQLKNICSQKSFGKKEGLDLRLKQILGLPPNVNKLYFVEFWVKPSDLFRPCPDAAIDDNSCGLGFPDGTTDEHKTWINNQRLASYYNATWDKNYPWTELGYTYDWNPKKKDHVGVSEFVIKGNADIVVRGFVSTEDYCSLDSSK